MLNLISPGVPVVSNVIVRVAFGASGGSIATVMRFQRRAVVARLSDADARTVSIGLIENASVCTGVAPLLRTVIVDRVRTSPSSPIAPVTFIETMPIAAGVGAGIDDVSDRKSTRLNSSHSQ